MHGKGLIGSALIAMIVLATICDARSIKNKASHSKRSSMDDSEDFDFEICSTRIEFISINSFFD